MRYPRKSRGRGNDQVLNEVQNDLAVDAFIASRGDDVMAVMTRSASSFSQADLANMIETGGWLGDAVGAPDFAAKAAAKLVSDEHRMTAFEHEGKTLYATPEQLEIEREMLDLAQVMVATRITVVDEAAQKKALEAFDEHIGDEIKQKIKRADFDLKKKDRKEFKADLVETQVAALQHLMSPGELTFLIGPPGAGKTEMMEALSQAFQGSARGAKGVVATAISDKITANLGNDLSIPGVTLGNLIDQLKTGEAPVEPGGMILLDEAGMVGSRQWRDLLKAAKDQNIRVVAVGDPLQIPPAEAGNPLRLFAERFECAELYQILRQRRKLDQEAAMDLRDGEAGRALKAYGERGMIGFTRGRAAVLEAVANQYVADSLDPDQDRSGAVILTPDRHDAAEANATVRANLKRVGRLADGKTAETLDGQFKEFSVGDKVILEETLVVGRKKKGGFTIPQGSTATVSAISANGIEITIDGDDARKATLDTTQPIGLDHAYALDLRRAQGIKNWNVSLAVTRPLSAGEALVAFSRHQHGVRATVDLDVYQDFASMAADFSKHDRTPMAIELAEKAGATTPANDAGQAGKGAAGTKVKRGLG